MSTANGLRINAAKTKAVFFRSRGTEVDVNQSLTLEGIPVEIVEKHKLLGVTFSAHMTWTCHIESLTKSLSRAAGVLSQCRHFLPENAKLQIYHALFSSHINYCLLVWGTTTLSNINTIQLLQKKALRYIANVPRNSSTVTLFTRYKIFSVKRMFDFRLMYAYFFSNEQFKVFIKDLSNISMHYSDSRTRSADKWLVPRSRTTYFMQSLRFTLPSLLNKYEEKDANFSTFTKKEMREFVLTLV